MTIKELQNTVDALGMTILHLQSRVRRRADGSKIPDAELSRTVNFLKSEIDRLELALKAERKIEQKKSAKK